MKGNNLCRKWAVSRKIQKRLGKVGNHWEGEGISHPRPFDVGRENGPGLKWKKTKGRISGQAFHEERSL